MNLFAAYTLALGAFTAGTQVARGVVRGVGKLIEGNPRAALTEVAGGLAAPVAAAIGQVCKLGEDVCRAAGRLVGDHDIERTTPARLPGLSRMRSAAVGTDGVAS
jgi:hypothetical protein